VRATSPRRVFGLASHSFPVAREVWETLSFLLCRRPARQVGEAVSNSRRGGSCAQSESAEDHSRLNGPPPKRLPTGTITFLFTDLEGSTRLWEHFPEQMRLALIRHDAIIESCVERHGGVVVRPRGEGDSRFAVFRARRTPRPRP
jgi:class 3 adenylate cyclase